jgi:hypothetical protein
MIGKGRVESLGDDLVAVIRTTGHGLSNIALDVSFGAYSRSRLFPC